MGRELVVRPTKSKVLIGNDFAIETPQGAPVGAFHMTLGRPNEFDSPETGRLQLTQQGFLKPRFEARRPDGAVVAAIEYEFVTGAMDLVADAENGKERRRLEDTGLLLPRLRLVESDGRIPLDFEAWRLFGKEYRLRIASEGTRWSDADLLAIAALVLHVRVSLSVLFTAAAGAGAIAPTRVTRGRGPVAAVRERLRSIMD